MFVRQTLYASVRQGFVRDFDAIRCGRGTHGVAAYVFFNASQSFRRTFHAFGTMAADNAVDALINVRLVFVSDAIFARNASVFGADMQTAQSDTFAVERAVVVCQT